VYLFYSPVEFKWVFATQMPAFRSTAEEEALHIAQTALVTLRDNAFSADQIDPSIRWEVTGEV
jgi:hypothetical protein